MKKAIIGFIIFLALFQQITINTFAADAGERIGKVYSTDAAVYMDGKPIEAYSVDGRLGIVCEDLKHYGFDIKWDEENRELLVATSGERTETTGNMAVNIEKKTGSLIGYIYSTNITTYVNGKKIPSYNMNGKTIILLEHFTPANGFTANWNMTGRRIDIIPYRRTDSIQTDIGKCSITSLKTMFMGDYSVIIKPGYITLDGSSVKLKNDMIDTGYELYIPLLDTLGQFEINYSWDDANSILALSDLPNNPVLKGSVIPAEKREHSRVQVDDVLYYINMKLRINDNEVPILGSLEDQVWGDLGFCVPYSKGALVYKGTVYIPAPTIAHYLDMDYHGVEGYERKK